jgi:hypothetical protein
MIFLWLGISQNGFFIENFQFHIDFIIFRCRYIFPFHTCMGEVCLFPLESAIMAVSRVKTRGSVVDAYLDLGVAGARIHIL